MSTIPNEVKQNRNTIALAATIAGRNAGNVTWKNARTGDAPSARAASSLRPSSWDQNPPTVRTTTAVLKNAWARRIANNDPSVPKIVVNAAATTTVGRTNGTVTNARAARRPGNANRESA